MSSSFVPLEMAVAQLELIIIEQALKASIRNHLERKSLNPDAVLGQCIPKPTQGDHNVCALLTGGGNMGKKGWVIADSEKPLEHLPSFQQLLYRLMRYQVANYEVLSDHVRRKVDQDAKQRLDKRPLLASLIENKTT
ncbi:hypothetical protein Tco_1561665 [Tanacetum coccineum]